MGRAGPRTPDLVASLLAGAVSLLFLTMGGAPTAWLAMQAGGIAAALLVLAMPGRFARLEHGILLLVPALLAATLPFEGAEGARRWLVLGPLRLHAGLLLLPLLLVVHARRGDRWSALAVALAGAIVAVQPDRAAALALALGALVPAVLRRNRADAAAALVACAALAFTLARPDMLAPVPLVEGVFALGWAMAPGLGALMLLAAISAMLLPLAQGARGTAAWACTGAWSGFLIASLLGAYPVPLIGFGLSAWIGWALSVRAARG